MGMASIGMNFAAYFAVCLFASLTYALTIGVAHAVVMRLFVSSRARLIVGAAFLVISVIAGAAFAHFSHRFPRWEEEPLPSNFKIIARYSPGFSDWLSWEDTITADGNVSQVIGPGRSTPGKTQKQMRLSQHDLAALLAKVNEAHFFQLREHYTNKHITDQPTLFLAVTAGSQTHTVDIYAYRHIEEKTDRAGVDCFLKVWTEVLAKVPSPNAEQVPRLYR
jgi:hypothetical protein